MFSDEQVAQVKTLFKEVFAQDKPLSGRVISDAILLRTEDEPKLFYVAHLPEDHVGQVTWLKVAVCGPNFEVSKEVKLEHFIMSLTSTGPEIPSPEEQPRYSPERFRSVTGREPNDPTPLLQVVLTLGRMLWEVRQLGFNVRTYVLRDESGALANGLELAWVDLEQLRKGYSQERFTVAFKSTKPEAGDVFFNTDHFDAEAWATDLFNGTDSFDDEAWATYFDDEAWATAWLAEALTPKSGVVVEELYGYEDTHDFYTWGEWDQYIESVMRG